MGREYADDSDSEVIAYPGPVEMRTRLRKLVRQEVRKMGKNSAALVDAIVDPDHPVFEYTLTTRKGGETALAQRFNSFGLTWKCPEEFSHRMHF